MGTVQKTVCPLVPAHSDISSSTVHVRAACCLEESESAPVTKHGMTFFFSPFYNIYNKGVSCSFFSFGEVRLGKCRLTSV